MSPEHCEKLPVNTAHVTLSSGIHTVEYPMIHLYFLGMHTSL